MPPALVGVAGSRGEDLEHRQGTATCAVGVADVWACGADIRDGEVDAARGLQDLRALLQRIVDSLNVVAG